MKGKTLRLRSVAALLIVAMAAMGCETTGQSAGLGAIVGGGLGALIGGERGALVGAALGAGAGAIIGHERQKQLASKHELEAEYARANVPVPVVPTVTVREMQVAPQSVNAGGSFEVNSKYEVMGPKPQTLPEGRLRVTRDGVEIVNEPLEEVKDGRVELVRKVELPDSMQPGIYDVELEIKNGDSVSTQRRTIEVA